MELDRIEEEYKISNEEESHERNSEGAAPDSPRANADPSEQKEVAERERQEKARKRIHSVAGYPDNVNMFEKLLNVEKTVNQPSVQHKHTNNRHRYSISVQDRIFKIKKN